ncbi:hypothetical protein [Streptomyces sp. NPDC056628]|uniref:hypothetical protein n=1 Tax=Streptomyces sp. NPDC056628 TaxID=3345882 RepID=UPI00368F604D
MPPRSHRRIPLSRPRRLGLATAAELVAGAPGENENAGSVRVFPSSASGITPTGSSTFGAGTLGTVAAKARPAADFDD